MKKQLIIVAIVATCGLANAQIFAQMFGGVAETPIPAVAWYRLDGNALDSSGNGYNGTWAGGEGYAAGKFTNTQAGSFSKTNVVSIARNIGASTAMTMTGWIYGLKDGLYPRLFGAEAVFAVLLYPVSTDGRPGFYGSGMNTHFPSSGNVYGASWKHIAVVYDGDGVECFVDGTCYGQFPKT